MAEILAPLGARSPFPWHYDTDMAFAYVSLFLLGITLGLSQWIVLRSSLPNALPWIPATMIGYILCAIIFAFANSDPTRLLKSQIVNNAILFGLMGFTIGVSQWWVLRQYYERSSLWVLASIFGFLFFLWLVVDPARLQSEFLLRGGMVGACTAALTGATLIWMIRQPAAIESDLTV
jgi:hypothetical protein